MAGRVGFTLLTMSGVQGLGQRAAAAGGPSGMASSLDHLGLQVNPENVLKVRAMLMAEADRLYHDMWRYEPQSMVRLCGGDPVSRQAMDGFNVKIRASSTSSAAGSRC